MFYVQSNFPEGPESMGLGAIESPELALCSPVSKMSTLPTCLLAPPLGSHSWQDFSQQKVDPALFKEHMGRALTSSLHPHPGPCVASIRVLTPLPEGPFCAPSLAPASYLQLLAQDSVHRPLAHQAGSTRAPQSPHRAALLDACTAQV